MAQPPSGTVTFLFTDIEDSAGLWDRYPGVMTGALARHDLLVKGAIERHDGYVFATGGDGFSAAFGGPMQAVDAAIDAQRELEAEDWGELGALRVRMALHTGIADERDGDFYGPPVNRTGRILSAARGGDVLISQTTLDLLRHHLQAAGLSTTDLGERRLKGIGVPERIHSLDLGATKSRRPPGRKMLIAGLVGLVGVAVLAAVVVPSALAPEETTTSSTTEAASVTTVQETPAPAGTVVWSDQLETRSTGLAIERGLLYVTTAAGDLAVFALDTGETEWAFDALGPIDHPPVVQGGVAYVTSRAGNRLYSVAGGEQLLRCSFGFLTPGPPSLIEESLYLGAGAGGFLYAIDSSAGAACDPSRSEYQFTRLQTITVPPVTASGNLYLADNRGDVIALRFDDPSAKAWSNPYFTGTGRPASYEGRVETLSLLTVDRVGPTSVTTEVTVLVTDAERRLHFVDGDTGLASRDPEEGTRGIPVVRDGRIYYLRDNRLIVLDEDLEEERSIELPAGEPTLGPIIEGGVAYYANEANELIALDLSSGDPVMVQPGPAPVDFVTAFESRVLIVDQTGLISLVELPAEP